MAPDPLKAPIRGSTQEHLDIETIQDDLVILKNGSCCLIMEVSAVNFGLLSETEQDAIIYAYAGLINSLSFPIQILIRSHRKDISSYLKLLSQQVEKEASPKIKSQIKKYHQFIESVVKENEVLDKEFYLIIPFSSLSLGIKSAFGPKVGKKGLPLPKEEILRRAKTDLYPKRDHVFGQFGRLGLKTLQLKTQKLVELFYNIYNPESRGQNLASPKQYQTSFVQPAIERMAPAGPPANTKLKTSKKNPLQGQKLQQHIEQVVQRVKNQTQ